MSELFVDSDDWLTHPEEFEVNFDYAYFGRDFESYFRVAIEDYESIETDIAETFQIISKPGKAKAVAQHCNDITPFIKKLTEELLTVELLG